MFREIFPLLIGFIFFATIGIAYFVTAKIYGHKSAIKSLAIVGAISPVVYLAFWWFSPAQMNIIKKPPNPAPGAHWRPLLRG